MTEQLLYYMLSLAKKGDKDVRPNSFSFDASINAFLKSKIKDAGKRAESILERGLEFAEEEGGEMLEIRSFNAILGYYSRQTKAADSPYRAEYILNRMISLFQAGYEDLSPHVSCFTSVMDAYAAQNNIKGGECAETLLRTMIRLKRDYSAQKIEMNSGVVNSVLKAWEASARSDGSGQRAERLLDLMEEKFDGGNLEMAPNSSSYLKVISTWSKSSSPDKVDRALAVLQRMKRRKEDGKLEGRIPEHAHSLVINACAFTTSEDPDEKRRTFQIARKIFDGLILESEQLIYRTEPSPTTYGWFIQVLGRVAPGDLKFGVLKETFDRCCEKQRLSPFVWETLKASCTDDELAQLLHPVHKFMDERTVAGKRLKFSDLPEAWKFQGYSDSDNTAAKNFIYRRRERATPSS